eukprot:2948802-Amphidinium_carterae.1
MNNPSGSKPGMSHNKIAIEIKRLNRFFGLTSLKTNNTLTTKEPNFQNTITKRTKFTTNFNNDQKQLFASALPHGLIRCPEAQPLGAEEQPQQQCFAVCRRQSRHQAK